MKITINGKQIRARQGETVLKAAGRTGIVIPTLCHDDKLSPYASCWLCVVKVTGRKRFTPACSTIVEDGMVITTDDDDIRATRRLCLELLLSEHCGDCLPPCQLACPAGCDARGYVNLIGEKRYDEAVRLIMETIPLPGTIGRICPHPCEDECRRQLVDEPVSICALKRFAADMAPDATLPRKKRSSGKRVAVIGSGPAGLSAAYFLAIEGHAVTIFEARKKPGGMLRYGIPEYRLPKTYLDAEIARITKLGIAITCGVAVGTDITIPRLRRQGFNAVLIAVGAQENREMGIDGEDLPGVYEGIDFLARIASGEPPAVGQRVIVVGGGDTAIDAARTALRLGADEVALVYRRSREEMPASAHEIAAAEAEGISLHFLTVPVKITLAGEGLTATCQRMALGEPDTSGRRRPVPLPGSEYPLACDAVIMAIGQTVDSSVLEGTTLTPTQKGKISAADDTLQTSRRAVFAAGDCVTGPDIAIRAIAAGRRAAHAIDSFLHTGRATSLTPLSSPARRANDEIEPAEYADEERLPRKKPKELTPRARRKNFREVARTYKEEVARREASRCLDCGCAGIKACTIRNLSDTIGLAAGRFSTPAKRHPLDERHPYIVRDPNKCIKCGRCIRVCAEVQGIAAWCHVGRGFDMEVAPPFGAPLQDTACESCGQCVTACPTGALTEKAVLPIALSVHAKATDTTCAHCGVGCGISVHTAGGRIGKITPQHNGNLCKKGKFDFGYCTDEKRIIFPMIRRGTRLVRTTMTEVSEAFRTVCRGIPGSRVAVFVSPRLTNGEAYTAQQLARTILRTNNIHPSGGVLYSKRFHRSHVPFVSPHAASIMEQSDAVVLIDPRTIMHNEVVALHIITAVRGGARLLVIGRKKTKLDVLAQEKRGVNPDDFSLYRDTLSNFIGNATKPVLVYNRSCLSETTVTDLHDFVMKHGTSLVSLCTEINEQGLLDAGVSPFLLPGQVPVGSRDARREFEQKWQGKIPARPGMDTGRLVDTMRKGKLDVALFLGGYHDPGKEIANALKNVRGVAVQALAPSPLTRRAHFVIPAASWVEKKGSFTRYDGKKLSLKPALPPLCGYSNPELWRLLLTE